eukprot:scaffold17011_cov135-Isochrysis_galbana.AAC.3
MSAQTATFCRAGPPKPHGAQGSHRGSRRSGRRAASEAQDALQEAHKATGRGYTRERQVRIGLQNRHMTCAAQRAIFQLGGWPCQRVCRRVPCRKARLRFR